MKAIKWSKEVQEKLEGELKKLPTTKFSELKMIKIFDSNEQTRRNKGAGQNCNLV